MVKITKETPIKTILEIGKECGMCNSCCKHDTGIVLDEDIPQIAKFFKISEKKVKEEHLVEHEKFNKKCYKFKQEKINGKPYGKCIMLDDNKGGVGCIIHKVKPIHCKVCSAKSLQGEKLVQWFALNYLVDVSDPESIRQWAVFLQYNASIPGGELEKLVPDKNKLKKILSYELLK